MRDLVKGFREIEQYGIDLLAVVESSGEVMGGDDELAFAGTALAKPMLCVIRIPCSSR